MSETRAKSIPSGSIAFPPVTSLAFRTFEDCIAFTDEISESKAYLVSYTKHYAVVCPSDELLEAQSIAWVAILLYPVSTDACLGVCILCTC